MDLSGTGLHPKGNAGENRIARLVIQKFQWLAKSRPENPDLNEKPYTVQ